MKRFVLDEISEWIEKVSYHDIPERVVKKTKAQILNNIAASFAGMLFRGANGLIESSRRVFSEKGSSTIFATGEKTSPARALFVNASLSMTFDYDDYLFLGHTGHSSVFTSFALWEELKISGKELIVATVIANEIAGRLGASVVLGPHNGQLWSFIHSAGSASSAARLLRLPRTGIRNALAIALYQPNFPLMPGFMSPDSKILTASIPALNGLISAYLAEKGLTGSQEIIEHPRGFLKYFSYEPLEFMLSGFGRSWVTDSIAFKIYPGCAYIDTTMDALFRAVEDIENVRGRRLKPEEVESVRVEASILTVGMDNISKEFLNKERLEAININFSIPFNVAIGIIAGRLTPSELKQEELDKNSHIIKSLASRVILKHNPSMTFRAIDSFINSGLIYKAIKKIGFTKLYQLRKKLKENIPEKAGLKIMEILPIMTLMRKIPEMWWKKNAFAISFDNFKLLFPASVIIRLNDGSEFYSSSEWPLGSNSDSEQIQRVERKFFEEGKRAGIKDIDKLFSLINNIEKRS